MLEIGKLKTSGESCWVKSLDCCSQLQLKDCENHPKLNRTAISEAVFPQEGGVLGKNLSWHKPDQWEKKGKFGTVWHNPREQRWDSGGYAGNPAGGKGQSHDFVVAGMGQDMAGITEELFPNMGTHAQGASLALQVCWGLR